MPNLTFQVTSVQLELDKALIRKIIRQAGNQIKTAAAALIGQGASGRMYGQHQASAAGQPPANLSGLLKASLKVSTKGTSATIVDNARDPSGAFYARFLETGAVGGGGKKGSKNLGRSHKKGGSAGKPQTSRVMAPRPFLSVAAEQELPKLQKQIEQALAKGITLKELKKQGIS